MADGDLWYRKFGTRASQEAAIIDAAFRERGIDIDGEVDEEDDRDVHKGGIAFMYAKDHILTREQYLGGEGVMPGPRPPQGSGKQRGVLDVLHDSHLAEIEVRRVVQDVMLVCLNPQGHKHPRDLGDDTPKGDDASAGGNDGTGEGHAAAPGGPGIDVLTLLDTIDAELGEGVATPDHVLTAAQELHPCSATEPQLPYGPAGPNPAICRGGGAKVRIFVADTGLVNDAAETFPWLAGVQGRDDPRELPDGTIESYGGHGTFVAGVLRSMAPEAQVYVADIFRTAGSALESEFVRRLNRSFRFGFEILHLTAACMTRHNIPLLSLETWLERLRAYHGVICVAPAGNFYTRRPSWPGAFPDVLSVGALAADWRHRADFSDYGSWVDVYAPGENLINAFGSGTYTYQVPPEGVQATFTGLAEWSGTSFSAPIVTGMIAARMVRCGESAREAADALLAKARKHRIPGVGPVLLPGCESDDGCCGGGCGCDRGCGCGCGDGCDCGCGGAGQSITSSRAGRRR